MHCGNAGYMSCDVGRGGGWQGMGEGEGAKDVSDQITDEDQLLGARQKDQPPPDQA